MNFAAPKAKGIRVTKAMSNHRVTTITMDFIGAKIFLNSSGLVTRMHLLMAVSDMVLVETCIRKRTENPQRKQPVLPNCHSPVYRVTAIKMPLVTKLRMSLIARAIMYTGVNFRKSGFRKKAANTNMFPRKPAMAKIVQEVDSKLTRARLREGSSNDDILFAICFEICKENEVKYINSHQMECLTL